MTDFEKDIKTYSTEDLLLIINGQKELYSPEELQIIENELKCRQKNEYEDNDKNDILPDGIKCSKCDMINSFENEVCDFCQCKLNKSLQYYVFKDFIERGDYSDIDDITLVCKYCGESCAWSKDAKDSDLPNCFYCHESEWIKLDINLRNFKHLSNKQQDELISSSTYMSIDECHELRQKQRQFHKVSFHNNLTETVESDVSEQNDYIPRCPICQSTDLSKISNAKKVGKIALFGIFGAGDIGKTWKCNNCGSRF